MKKKIEGHRAHLREKQNSFPYRLNSNARFKSRDYSIHSQALSNNQV